MWCVCVCVAFASMLDGCSNMCVYLNVCMYSGCGSGSMCQSPQPPPPPRAPSLQCTDRREGLSFSSNRSEATPVHWAVWGPAQYAERWILAVERRGVHYGSPFTMQYEIKAQTPPSCIEGENAFHSVTLSSFHSVVQGSDIISQNAIHNDSHCAWRPRSYEQVRAATQHEALRCESSAAAAVSVI